MQKIHATTPSIDSRFISLQMYNKAEYSDQDDFLSMSTEAIMKNSGTMRIIWKPCTVKIVMKRFGYAI